MPRVRSPSPEIVNEINPDDTMYDSNGELLEVFSLPEPSMSEEAFPKNRIPSPVPLEKEELNLDYVRKHTLFSIFIYSSLFNLFLFLLSKVKKPFHTFSHR